MYKRGQKTHIVKSWKILWELDKALIFHNGLQVIYELGIMLWAQSIQKFSLN